MENQKNKLIEFLEIISRFGTEFDNLFNDLNQLEKQELILESQIIWDKNISMFKCLETVSKGISFTKELEGIKDYLLQNGYSLEKAIYIALNINKEINIKRIDKIDFNDIDRLASVDDKVYFEDKLKYDLVKSLIKTNYKIDFNDIDFTSVDGYFESIQNAKNLKKFESKETQLSKNKVQKKQIAVHDFFKIETNIEIINAIKSTFSEYEGKKMAILIYLLQSDFKLINLIPSSKTKSKKHFISLIKSSKDFNYQPISKYFDQDKLRGISETDLEYIEIRENINEILQKSR